MKLRPAAPRFAVLFSTRPAMVRMAALAAALGLQTLGASAAAQSAPAPSAQDVALAEKAFNEGVALAQAGNCQDAIVKLELSQKIDPASGTALNLGNCYETLGRTASAYGAYSQSAGLARVKVNDRIRAQAEERMAAIAPLLSNVEFRLAKQAAAPAGMAIAIDGKPLAAGALGVALPVDPGSREIEISAPNKKPHKISVVVPSKPGTMVVEIPALEDAPVAKGSLVATETPAGSSMSTGVLVAIVGLAGAGNIAVGVGIGFGVDSIEKNAASKKLCQPADETKCSAGGVDLRNQAYASATASTAAIAVGVGALAAAGGVWIVARLVGRKDGAKSEAGVSALGVGPGGVVVRGQW